MAKNMKKHTIIASMAIATLLLGACNDDYNYQFDIDDSLTDVKSITYTLTSSDYSSIASNSTNQEIALAKDPETEAYVDALTAVGTNKYFTDDASAEDYVPAFLANKYPNADSGSTFVVYYNQYQSPSDYLDDFSSISTYTLTSSDYETVWGDNVKATYLSPSTLSDIPSLLAANVSDAEEGDIVVVNYAYSDQEPSTGGSTGTTGEPTWTQVDLLNRASGSNWNYVNVGPISLADFAGETVHIGFRYTSSSAAAPTWELKNFKAMSAPYMDVYVYALQDDGTYAKQTSFAGAGSYVFLGMGTDGAYYPFGLLKASSYTYGYMYSSAVTVTDGVIAADDAADWVITVEAGVTDGTYTLKNALDKYIYASGSYNSFNLADATDGTSNYEWTITKAGGADLFEIVNTYNDKTVKLYYYSGSWCYGMYSDSTLANYIYEENSLLGDEGDFTIYTVTTDDALSYIWTNTSSYGWKASAYANSTYYTTESYLVSPAIEIDESATLPCFTIDETYRYSSGSGEDITAWVSTDYDTTMATGLKGLAAQASSTNNAAAVYAYDGSSWSEYTTDEAAILAVDESIYNALGTSYLEDPSTTIPTVLAQKYPYAVADDVVGVVYQATSSSLTIAEYTYDGTTWAETSTTIVESLTFSKNDSGDIEAEMSTFLSQSFLSSNEGGFSIEDINLSGLTYVWTTTASYGWKASAYANSTYYAAESYLVSSEIDLRKATQPLLSITHVHRYLNDESDQPNYLNVVISTDYSGDAASATWTPVTVTWATGSDWTFVTSTGTDLTEFAGNKVRLAFHYQSDTGCAPTWEISAVSIKEAETEEEE